MPTPRPVTFAVIASLAITAPASAQELTDTERRIVSKRTRWTRSHCSNRS